MSKEKEKNKLFIVGIIFIILGIISSIIPSFISYKKDEIESKMVDDFFKKTSTFEKDINSEDLSREKTLEQYFMILEIPKINLKKGIYNRSSKYNSINHGIAILKESDLPTSSGSNLILASHSGTAKISYFNRLDELSYDDIVVIYYGGIKYTYTIIDNYDIAKTGTAAIYRDRINKVVTLITCRKDEHDMQTVYIGTLSKEENY